jgi:hypothetical protein
LKRVKNQLLNLSIGEFAALCTFIFVYKSLKVGMGSLVGFSYLIFILLQGSMYWLYRYRLLIKTERFGQKAIKIFRFLKYFNMVVSVISVIIIPVISSSNKELILSAGVLLFGIIEYINYYWYRLSYGKSGFNIKILFNTKLKKSSLNKMIS